MDETFKKNPIPKLPIFVSDSITNNIYSKVDIFRNNIKKATDFINSSDYEDIDWIEKILLREKLIEQQSLLDYYVNEIKKLNNLTFRFGS
jgi:hypothetical protein